MKLLQRSYFVYSMASVAVVTILSEWLHLNDVVYFPPGFRHFIITILFLINWLLYGRRISRTWYIYIAAVMLFYLILSYFFNPISLYNYILGSTFTFMFTVLFILGMNTKINVHTIYIVLKRLLWAIILISIFSVTQGIIAKTTLRYSPGLFREAGALASFLNIGTIISFSLYIYTKNKKYLQIALVLSFLVVLTTLKKSMISNIMIWIFYGFTRNLLTAKIKLYLGIGILLIVSLYLLKDEFIDDYEKNYYYYEQVGPGQHVRTAMYLAAFNIASDYFPVGSGLGTFASLSSIIGGYSDVHFRYGVASIGSNSPESVARGHHTLLDTYWPHILGELGWIGMALFLLLWFYPLVNAYSLIKSKGTSNALKSFAFYIVLINIIMSLEGFALYTPEIPTFVLFHSGISGLCFHHILTKGDHDAGIEDKRPEMRI